MEDLSVHEWEEAGKQAAAAVCVIEFDFEMVLQSIWFSEHNNVWQRMSPEID